MLSRRPRRNRISTAVRELCAETGVRPADLVMPLFIQDGKGRADEIKNYAGYIQIDEGLKDKTASLSYNKDCFYLRSIADIKRRFPDLAVITDTAMDPYSSDGHDGIFSEGGRILNDETLEILGRMALAQAEAGADIIAPSDMMDGRVGYIRNALDNAGFQDKLILSYTAKYASSFYGPFRDALQSAPKHGDKKTYQMDMRNVREAMTEAELDVQEGADMLMVKPGLPYLDVISKLSQSFNIPVAAYNVSGEYAAVKFAALNGALDYRAAVTEILLSFKRAGADFILTYHASEAAQWLTEKA
ncbi:hypothetical protein CHS0354_006953 [Potamilus streckersoni]|uniref:Delta-aminolevulinic acid dehydratase n=1 Tax=Potamilus streckersoni TaxID=2493646 RepID=A0AAE0WCW4_9BIVA|nr:hypothetical protein CHS0354_006953 [Potamilus streckersoni]